MYIRRFLKRNRLTVRRTTDKGRKKRSDMERTVEEDGILAYLDGHENNSSVYNMNQTAVYIDMNGITTVDFAG
ncbi:hypothetical protein PR003_g5184 [Phytophthora rubi]|uniref:HTH CENPB-type domain-containing protein n=1 Tax=Phytophthora rubi TaxID=129364 RepID=A0A6A3N3D8_9STRA|nr:hypothetical protein PR002_g5240 [Phytophthora rubi]KAE9045300.1 hypothetical protein PR001_g5032 [Phytophthora rubi]KAE9350836.1 hypothetical protein PR003_g5184 [Phytophthora rubi]